MGIFHHLENSWPMILGIRDKESGSICCNTRSSTLFLHLSNSQSAISATVKSQRTSWSSVWLCQESSIDSSMAFHKVD